MKTWQVPLAFAVLVVVSAVAGSLSFPSQTAARERRSGTPSRDGGEVAAADAEAAEGSSRNTAVRSSVDPASPVASSTRAKDSAADAELVATMVEQLDLSELQLRQVEEILQDRGLEIEDVHRSIRASGIFNARQYSCRIREIQGRSYDRVEGTLNSRQFARFREMLARREINDAVAFSLDPGMAIVE